MPPLRSARCASLARGWPSTASPSPSSSALWLFFGLTLYGKALRATAVNRLGARLVGIRTTLSGQIAFLLASVIGALSGILIVPITTLYYDTGFLIGLKGFIAAIIGGLVSYPLTAIAALMVGIVEAFSSFYASNFKEVIVFTLTGAGAAVALVGRARGGRGREGLSDARALAHSSLRPDHGGDPVMCRACRRSGSCCWTISACPRWSRWASCC